MSAHLSTGRRWGPFRLSSYGGPVWMPPDVQIAKLLPPTPTPPAYSILPKQCLIVSPRGLPTWRKSIDQAYTNIQHV